MKSFFRMSHTAITPSDYYVCSVHVLGCSFKNSKKNRFFTMSIISYWLKTSPFLRDVHFSWRKLFFYSSLLDISLF